MIIDMHAHVMDEGYPAGSDQRVEADTMLSAMDRYGIQEMWVSSAPAFVREAWRYNKRQYTLFQQKAPARFRCYGVFNPYFPQETREDVKRCFEDYGFSGIKVHTWLQGLVPHQKALYELVEASIFYRVPILFHDGTPPYADTLQVAALAGRYPEATLFLGHAGLYDAHRAAIQAANTHDNVWLILMGPTIGGMREIIAAARPDRLLFGTDYCFGGGDWTGDTLIDDRIDIVRSACPDAGLLADIFSNNARACIRAIKAGHA